MENTGFKEPDLGKRVGGGSRKGIPNKGGDKMFQVFLALERENRLKKLQGAAYMRVRELLIASGVDPEQVKSTDRSLLPLLSPSPAVTLGLTEILTRMEETVKRLSDTTKYPVRTRNRKKKPKVEEPKPE